MPNNPPPCRRRRATARNDWVCARNHVDDNHYFVNAREVDRG